MSLIDFEDICYLCKEKEVAELEKKEGVKHETSKPQMDKIKSI